MRRIIYLFLKLNFLVFSILLLFIFARTAYTAENGQSVMKSSSQETPLPSTAPSFVDILSPLGPIGGNIFQVAIQGSYAYLYTGYELLVVDLSTPASPQVVQRQAMPSIFTHVSQLVSAGNYLYMAIPGLVDEVRIFDISQPTAPQYISSWFHTDNVYGNFDLTVIGHYVYVALDDGLHVLNVMTPAVPVEVAYSPWELRPFFPLWIEGGYGYSGGQSFLILDISNPTAITLISQTEVPTITRDGVEIAGGIVDVVVAGNFAYAAAGPIGVQVLDITDPFSPVQASLVDTILDAQQIVVVDNYALVTGIEGQYLLDITDPYSPTQVNFTPSWDQFDIYDVVAADNTVYLSDGDFHIIDLATLPPQVVGSLKSKWEVNSIEIVNNTAYLATFSTFQTFDLTDPMQLQAQGTYTAPGELAAFTLAGNYAYIAAGTQGLRVLDITSPDSLIEIGSLPIPGYTNKVTIAGNYAYVLSGPYYLSNFDLHIVDISNPMNPQAVDVLHWTADILEIAIYNHYLYMATNDVSDVDFRILDVSHPNNIQEVGSIKEYYTSMNLHDGLLYLVDHDGNLSKFDLSDPINPTSVWTINPVGNAVRSSLIVDNYLYLCTAIFAYFPQPAPGLQVFDMTTNPPREIHRFNHPCHGIGVKDKTVYLLADDAIYVLQYVPGKPFFLPVILSSFQN